jgi:hypothetical protein
MLLTQIRFRIGILIFSALISLLGIPGAQAFARIQPDLQAYNKLNVDVIDLYSSGMADVEIPEDTDGVKSMLDELESSQMTDSDDDLSSSGMRSLPILPLTD